MRSYLTGLIILLITSCTQEKKEHIYNSENNNSLENIMENSNEAELSSRAVVLIEQKKYTAFSEYEEKDEFLIYIIGETLYTGTAIFQITNHEGVVIHNEINYVCNTRLVQWRLLDILKDLEFKSPTAPSVETFYAIFGPTHKY